MPKHRLRNRRRIHLAFYTNLFYPNGNIYVLRSLMKGLAGKGFTVTLIARLNKGMSSFTRSLSGIRQVIPLDQRAGAFKILPQLAKDPPDVFVNSGPGGGFAEIALRLRRPLFWRVTNHPQWWGSLQGASPERTRQIIRQIGLLSTRMIALSDHVKSCFIREGFRRIETLYDGCDTNRFRPDPRERAQFRREFGLREKELAIGTVANIEWRKRQDILIRALSLVPPKFPFKCFLVGDSSQSWMQNYKRKLQDAIQKLRLSNKIVFTGLRNDIRRVMNGLDIFLLPSLGEGCPSALLEAMACEKPVIVSRTGPFPEIVTHNREGILAEPGNPDSFAKELEKLCGDPEKRTAMGKRGRLKVTRQFSLDRQVNAYASFFEKYSSRGGF